MTFPATVWPGAVVGDWFGLIAFYVSWLCVVALIILTTWVYVWFICKLWRMRYRGEGWWD